MRFAIALGLILFFGFVSTSGADDVDAERVRRSIDLGKRFLISRQNDDGSWQGLGSFKDGSSALITLALLNAGVPASDRSMVKALRYLEGLREVGLQTYTVSLRIMVFCAANPKKYRDRIQRDVQWLKRAQTKGAEDARFAGNFGGWSYGVKAGGSADASNAQFALLALHEARLAGIKVDKAVWENARSYWLRLIYPGGGGGFTYTIGDGTMRGSMTCAGISSMIIIHENLMAAEEGKNLDITCCGGSMRPDSINKAIDWMSADIHFRVTGNPIFTSFRVGTHSAATKFYYLYGLERAGRLAGIRFFGNHDWYREGVEHLLKVQHSGGFWATPRIGTESNEEVATSLALLFLSKGKRPVVIGKYRYRTDRSWDMHPTGIHYLTRKIEQAWKMKLNWQTIDGRKADVDDLLETPVLFISGREAIELTKKQKETLKEYVDNGGFIFAEACQGDGCGESVPFDTSFRELMGELFPNSKLQLLDPVHPIWQAWFQIKKPNPNRPILGIQSSCRTSVVYIPQNMSGLWRLNQPGRLENYKTSAQQDIDVTTQMGVNIVAYATNRQLKEKGERPKVAIGDSNELGSRVLEIPKLTHSGGADDAPNAWRNMLQRLRFDRKRPVKMEKKFVAARIEEMEQYPIIFLHGRSAFKFTEKERESIRIYLERGGFLFADSICSSPRFTESFRKEMKEILPGSKMEAIPKDSPIWKEQSYSGYEIRNVEIRTPIANDRGETFRTQTTHPLLEGIKVKGRYGVVFSPFDLSCAMENASGSQCKGYSKDDASKIAVNVVLYALLQIPTEED